MIYALLFYEFFKIGLFAIGGGAVTIPFLFDLTEKHNWFTTAQLTDMIAIAESTPGPLGVNMATFAGFQSAGILGGIIATFGLVLPSVVIIIWISKLLKQFSCNPHVQTLLASIRPGVLALIIFAGWQIARISIVNLLSLIIFCVLTVLIYFYKKSPIFYILISAAAGIIFKL